MRTFPTAHKRSKLRNIVRNLVSDLIVHEHVKVVKSKKLAVQKLFTRVVNLARSGSLQDYRQIFKIIFKQIKDDKGRFLLVKLKELVKKYESHSSSGYLRVYNLGPRRGDSATVYYLSLF